MCMLTECYPAFEVGSSITVIDQHCKTQDIGKLTSSDSISQLKDELEHYYYLAIKYSLYYKKL